MPHDLVIRNGAIYDGNGGEPIEADIAVSTGKIVEIGSRVGAGRDEVDAAGCIITPGFIDVHTHYDGQATWESRMQPSSGHGVTTAIGGNCGVGFAPCRPKDRELLVKLMEGVEDVPEVVMTEGLPWSWETFPDYLDFLAQQKYDIDFGVHVPHSPIRVYVMGKRGADREAATHEDIAQMSALVEEGVRAGGFGISTSRFMLHRTKAGEIAPTVDAAEEELIGLAQGLRRADAGVFQLVPQVFDDATTEYGVMKRVAESAQRPLSFSLVAQQSHQSAWREFLELMRTAQPKGSVIRGQVYPRPIGMMLGLDLSFNPFCLNPSYLPLAQLSLSERVAEMRKPEVRSRLLSEQPTSDNPFALRLVDIERPLYRLGDPPCYNPPPELELGRLAAAQGRTKAELAYDVLLEQDGKSLIYCPSSNFINNSLDAAGEMMRDANTILGLGDGGAHYGMICDASFPTFLLTHWVRDAAPPDAIPLPEAIKSLSADLADAVGLSDRGRIEVGKKADINVIDLQRLKLGTPRTVYDLPAGGRRLRQIADGYEATIVAGEITYRNGQHTGALPGRLVRRGAP